MKIKTKLIVVALSMAISGMANADFSSIKKQLQQIKWMESSSKSRKIVSELTREASSSDMALVQKQALLTGNVDLISLIRQRVEGEDWTKKKTWEEGLGVASRHAGSFEVLGKWNSSIKTNFKSYFSNAPDVPYERITDWHIGYGFRGLQGVVLKTMAIYDIESFKKVVEMLNDDTVGLSKKRTIVWAMRYDYSGFSEKALKSGAPQHGRLLTKDVKDTLKVLKLGNNKGRL